MFVLNNDWKQLNIYLIINIILIILAWNKIIAINKKLSFSYRYLDIYLVFH